MAKARHIYWDYSTCQPGHMFPDVDLFSKRGCFARQIRMRTRPARRLGDKAPFVNGRHLPAREYEELQYDRHWMRVLSRGR